MDEINQTSQPPVTTPQTKSSVNLIWPIIFIIFGVVIGLLINSAEIVNKFIANFSPGEKEPETIPTPTVNPEANWITYNNSKYNFTFRYPANWTPAGPNSPGDTTLTYLNANEGVTASSSTEPALKYMIWVAPENKTSISKYTDLIVSHDFTSDSIVYKTGNEPSRLGALAYLFTKDNNTFIKFALTPYNENLQNSYPQQDKYVTIFKQILATFNFLTLATPTISSNTTTNPNAGLQYPKRNFTATDKISNEIQYPAEITGLKDSDLIGMNCGPKFFKEADGSFIAVLDNNQRQPLADQNLLSFADNIQRNINPSSKSSIISLMTCKTENNKTIISYEITPGMGGAGSNVYFGFLMPDYSAPVISVVPIENGPYFNCFKTLALTNTGLLYADCGAGDGGFGSESLYRINLNQSSNAVLLFKCTSVASSVEGAKPTVKCGTTQ